MRHDSVGWGQTHPSACSLPNASPQARGTSSFVEAFLVRTIDVRRRNTALDSQAGPAPPPSLLGTPGDWSGDAAAPSDPTASDAKLGPAYVPREGPQHDEGKNFVLYWSCRGNTSGKGIVDEI